MFLNSSQNANLNSTTGNFLEYVKILQNGTNDYKNSYEIVSDPPSSTGYGKNICFNQKYENFSVDELRFIDYYIKRKKNVGDLSNNLDFFEKFLPQFAKMNINAISNAAEGNSYLNSSANSFSIFNSNKSNKANGYSFNTSTFNSPPVPPSNSFNGSNFTFGANPFSQTINNNSYKSPFTFNSSLGTTNSNNIFSNTNTNNIFNTNSTSNNNSSNFMNSNNNNVFSNNTNPFINNANNKINPFSTNSTFTSNIFSNNANIFSSNFANTIPNTSNNNPNIFAARNNQPTNIFGLTNNNFVNNIFSKPPTNPFPNNGNPFNLSSFNNAPVANGNQMINQLSQPNGAPSYNTLNSVSGIPSQNIYPPPGYYPYDYQQKVAPLPLYENNLQSETSQNLINEALKDDFKLEKEEIPRALNEIDAEYIYKNSSKPAKTGVVLPQKYEYMSLQKEINSQLPKSINKLPLKLRDAASPPASQQKSIDSSKNEFFKEIEQIGNSIYSKVADMKSENQLMRESEGKISSLFSAAFIHPNDEDELSHIEEKSPQKEEESVSAMLKEKQVKKILVNKRGLNPNKPEDHMVMANMDTAKKDQSLNPFMNQNPLPSMNEFKKEIENQFIQVAFVYLGNELSNAMPKVFEATIAVGGDGHINLENLRECLYNKVKDYANFTKDDIKMIYENSLLSGDELIVKENISKINKIQINFVIALSMSLNEELSYPTNSSTEYTTRPPLKELLLMPLKKLKSFEGFRIENEFGSVVYDEPINLTECDLGKLVEISYLRMEPISPKVMDKDCTMELYKVELDRYKREKIKEMIENQGGIFLNYFPESKKIVYKYVKNI